MKHVFDEPVFQKLYEQEHPFFVNWAETKDRPRDELAIELAKERHDQTHDQRANQECADARSHKGVQAARKNESGERNCYEHCQQSGNRARNQGRHEFANIKPDLRFGFTRRN